MFQINFTIIIIIIIIIINISHVLYSKYITISDSWLYIYTNNYEVLLYLWLINLKVIKLKNKLSTISISYVHYHWDLIWLVHCHWDSSDWSIITETSDWLDAKANCTKGVLFLLLEQCNLLFSLAILSQSKHN